mmetsp:Transcript_23464/g.89144  ORF Transcript_23464/g.89144 Transcript_23464/m.89144 type:complete len:269 (+) Transcript_23464:452-1258(+)
MMRRAPLRFSSLARAQRERAVSMMPSTMITSHPLTFPTSLREASDVSPLGELAMALALASAWALLPVSRMTAMPVRLPWRRSIPCWNSRASPRQSSCGATTTGRWKSVLQTCSSATDVERMVSTGVIGRKKPCAATQGEARPEQASGEQQGRLAEAQRGGRQRHRPRRRLHHRPLTSICPRPGGCRSTVMTMSTPASSRSLATSAALIGRAATVPCEPKTESGASFIASSSSWRIIPGARWAWLLATTSWAVCESIDVGAPPTARLYP